MLQLSDHVKKNPKKQDYLRFSMQEIANHKYSDARV